MMCGAAGRDLKRPTAVLVDSRNGLCRAQGQLQWRIGMLYNNQGGCCCCAGREAVQGCCTAEPVHAGHHSHNPVKAIFQLCASQSRTATLHRAHRVSRPGVHACPWTSWLEAGSQTSRASAARREASAARADCCCSRARISSICCASNAACRAALSSAAARAYTKPG